jgi:hypothetical protein
MRRERDPPETSAGRHGGADRQGQCGDAVCSIARRRGGCGLGLGAVRPPELAPIPRIALTRDEAATSLGMSLDSFERHVQPTIRLVRLGRMRLVPVAELSRWIDENAERVL